MPALHLGNWTAGIGDPTTMGWATVVSYYAAALLCLAAAGAAHSDSGKSSRGFWFFAFALMALLGVCKQWNLPSALTEIGRIVARSGGWMADRRPIQALAMALCVLAGAAIIALLWKKIPAVIKKRYRLTIAFLVYIVAFVVLRAISLHGWESVLGYRILGLRINWIGELSGIAGVALTAIAGIINVKLKRTRS